MYLKTGIHQEVNKHTISLLIASTNVNWLLATEMEILLHELKV